MRRHAVLVALVLAALPASEAASQHRAPCATLPSGYTFRLGGDRLTLIPPYTLRATRGGAHCDITLSACGADNTWTADDVIAAITQPVVVRALAQDAVLGNGQDPSPFVMEHAGHRLTVGGPCPNVAGVTCRPVPPEVANLVHVL